MAEQFCACAVAQIFSFQPAEQIMQLRARLGGNYLEIGFGGNIVVRAEYEKST